MEKEILAEIIEKEVLWKYRDYYDEQVFKPRKLNISSRGASLDIADWILNHIHLDEDKMKDILPDLVEKHFPKGECQERGQAIVLGAELLIAISQLSLKIKDK